jgi:hypothetical protein
MRAPGGVGLFEQQVQVPLGLQGALGQVIQDEDMLD